MWSTSVKCVFVAILLFAVQILATTSSSAFNENNSETSFLVNDTESPTPPSPSPPASSAKRARSMVTHTDEYIARNQRQCFESRSLVSCIKYKASKIIWKLATNAMGYFPSEQSRELSEDKRRIRFIQLAEPADVLVFDNAKSLEGDNEAVRIMKFFKRAAETFGRNHGVQFRMASDTGARIVTSDTDESRGLKKKQRKWAIILPLIILMKLAHLKGTLVTLLLAVLGLNVLLVGGTAWLVHYLKYKTLCKIHPQLVQTHSHVYDSDPNDYSQFVGSSFSGSHHGSSGYSPHEVNVGGYSKDWASRKAYSGYNYLDTISKRLP